ncbi:tetratricopeptide repeat protein [Thermodesulfobacteriota bacterium]
MDDFFRKLYTASSTKDLFEAAEVAWEKLRKTKGNELLDYALMILKWVEQYPLLRWFAIEVIDFVFLRTPDTSTEKAALLLYQEAYYHYAIGDIPKATYLSDLALKGSRDIGSSEAENYSLILKGCLCDAKKEHKKASTWYAMALAKCTKFKRPSLMLNMGISLSKQGEYSEAWSLINQAKSLAKDLSDDMSFDDIERTGFKRIVAEAYLHLGQVQEVIGDFDGALRTYDKGLSLSMQYSFTTITSKLYLYKAQANTKLGRDSEADDTMEKAFDVLGEGGEFDPNSRFDYYLYVINMLKNEKQYEPALKFYKVLLFGDSTDAQTESKNLNGFMENKTNTFLEIVQGIAVCLHATERIAEAEIISREGAKFSQLKQQTGIENESDRDYKLQIEKKSLGAELRQVLFDDPDFVKYKNIQAQYYSDEEKKYTVFKTDEKEIVMARRYFLVFKCLVKNAEKRVSERMLESFAREEGEHLADPSGLRGYVGRLKKAINLDQFLEDHGGKGWILKAP